EGPRRARARARHGLRRVLDCKPLHGSGARVGGPRPACASPRPNPMRLLIGLANGLLTLWEQARGRRRHADQPESIGPGGSRTPLHGAVATVILLNWRRCANVRAILHTHTPYHRVAA